MLGREERVLEERSERMMGGVRWGMNWESDSWGFEMAFEVSVAIMFFINSVSDDDIFIFILGFRDGGNTRTRV